METIITKTNHIQNITTAAAVACSIRTSVTLSAPNLERCLCSGFLHANGSKGKYSKRITNLETQTLSNVCMAFYIENADIHHGLYFGPARSIHTLHLTSPKSPPRWRSLHCKPMSLRLFAIALKAEFCDLFSIAISNTLAYIESNLK